MAENKPGIYYIKNIINNKVYIGSSLSVKRRITSHKNDLNKNNHHSVKLQRAVNKYGIENFEFDILEYMYFPKDYNKNTKIQYLESLEEYYIKYFNSYKKGYNCSEIPRIPGNTNTKESIKKGIDTRRKRGSFNFTEEHKRKISESLKNSKKLKDSIPTRKLLRSKKVYQYDLQGNFIKEWDSRYQIEEILGIPASSIRKCTSGENIRCWNFRFLFEKFDKVISYKELKTIRNAGRKKKNGRQSAI